jgi:hypothetical protein
MSGKIIKYSDYSVTCACNCGAFVDFGSPYAESYLREGYVRYFKRYLRKLGWRKQDIGWCCKECADELDSQYREDCYVSDQSHLY